MYVSRYVCMYVCMYHRYIKYMYVCIYLINTKYYLCIYFVIVIVIVIFILTRADYLFIHNNIRSLLNIILRSILMVRTSLEPASYCLCV